jgi:hypothetical protein
MKMSGELQTVTSSGMPMELTPKQVTDQVQLIQQVMRDAMKDGEHYGKIPGCGEKPALLKAGAEKLSLTFRLAPSYKIERLDLPNGHREYIIICELRHIETGKLLGAGVGSCSTMESKYRWRAVDAFEVTELAIPRDSKERKTEYRKQGFGMKKVDNEWKWVRFTGDGSKVENPDIADQYNTVLKMGKKRAQVDATLTALAASDIFTQDIEERLEDAQHVTATVVDSQPLQAKQSSPVGQTETPDDLRLAKTKKYAAECTTVEDLAKLKKEMVENKVFFSPEIIRALEARYNEIKADSQSQQMDEDAANAAERDVT